MDDLKALTELMASSEATMLVLVVFRWRLRLYFETCVMHKFTCGVRWAMHAKRVTVVPYSNYHH